MKTKTLDMKKLLLTLVALTGCLFANGETMKVNRFKYAGPYTVSQPYMADQTDVNGKSYNEKGVLDTYLSFTSLENAPIVGELPAGTPENTLNLIGFTLKNERFAKGEIKVEGVENYAVYVNGKKLSGSKLELIPASHSIVVKYVAQKDAPQISIECQQDGILSLREDGFRDYTLQDVLHGTRFQNISLSPDGKYLITNYSTGLPDGKSERSTTLTELATGKVSTPMGQGARWMPKSNLYYYIQTGAHGQRNIVTVNPATGKETLFAANIPDGSFTVSPAEDYLLYTLEQKGPEERKEIYQVLEPDDRQSGWRNRTYLAKYDLASGIMQQLTFGYRNIWASDISADGKKMLFMESHTRLEKRPTTLYSLYLMDMATMQVDTLVENDGFLNSARFSPCGSQIVISGSPEALDGIGKNVKEGQTPSMYDYQLYIMNLADKKITPVTKDFNPNVGSYVWNRYDGQIYFTAENTDLISLFKMDPVSGKIVQMPVGEDLVNRFTLATAAPVMVWYGQGASNSDRSYIVDLKKGKTTLLEDLSREILAGVKLGECHGWNFTNSKGDEINGRYYLPANFDPSKKYPLIVNYYGGCSPTERNFESRYPHHLYAAMGYVVYVVNPSGATGFGQEFSARHVNTAGNGPADDIVEGTKQFCKEHSFVDASKIGCIGASYGGFTTMYLQTITDIFAAAISHAGISDHTSYWGEGYWGYSYSEVSMANSYPWSETDLYVKQSPLYNAQKVNTPILFVHGDADTNVPVGESIQMYTALKLLGKETDMVLVKDQNHHILDYNKRILWQNTIFAWFAKWLQNDPTWWDTIYPPKTL